MAEMSGQSVGVSRAPVADTDQIYDREHYDRILGVADLLQMMIAPSNFIQIVQEFSTKQCLGHDVSSNILELSAGNKNGGYGKAWKLFVQNLPAFSEDWYWELMNLLSNTPEDLDVRSLINSDYEDELKERQALLGRDETTDAPSTSGIVGSSSRPVTGNSFGDDRLVVLEVWQSFVDWYKGVLTPSNNHTDFRSTMGYDSEESDDEDGSETAEILHTRNYQEELAAPAIAGKNSIVVAPTGSGKTFVAVRIIQHHLESVTDDGRRGKVAFLVPTVHLIEQQALVLKRFLKRSFKVKGLRGGQVGLRSVPKAVLVRNNDILVMTPQILLNMMLAPVPDTDPIQLEFFTLLVFDECHHSKDKHAYNQIMTEYLNAKFNADTNSNETHLPQVVGLTASLGVEGADTNLKARQSVLSVCANLDTEILAMVEKYANELAEHVAMPIDDLVRIPSPHMKSSLSTYINNVMFKIENNIVIPRLVELKPESTEEEEASGTPKFTANADPPKRKHLLGYASWAWTWKNELPKLDDASTKQTLITAFEHLIVYHNAMFLNGHVLPAQALSYLTGQLAELERKRVSDIDNELIRMYKEDLMPHINIGAMHKDSNPMVEKLKEILLTELHSNPDGRALVFVCTRELTVALAEYMNQEPQLRLLRAERLTGVQASKEKGGQSAKEQQQVLERFRNGFHRVLVATSVGEEGLDVAQCNLIIKYNHVSNEVAMVQRRGRGRAMGSRSILLAQDGAIEEREMANMIRERLMISVVQYIGRMGSHWFRHEVTKLQQQAYSDRNMKKSNVERKRAILQGKIYDMLCQKCDTFMQTSANVRTAQNRYVGVDASIWDRLVVDPSQSPRVYETEVIAGKIYCAKCHNESGEIIKYVGVVYLPTFKAESFLFQCQDETRERQHFRKWKKIEEGLFVADPITRYDFRSMFNALRDPNTLNKLEENIRRAESKLRDEHKKMEMQRREGQ